MTKHKRHNGKIYNKQQQQKERQQRAEGRATQNGIQDAGRSSFITFVSASKLTVALCANANSERD